MRISKLAPRAALELFRPQGTDGRDPAESTVKAARMPDKDRQRTRAGRRERVLYRPITYAVRTVPTNSLLCVVVVRMCAC